MMESNKQKFYQKSSFYIAIFTALLLVATVLIFMLMNNNNSAAVNGTNVSDSETNGTDVDNAVDTANQGEDGEFTIVVDNQEEDLDTAITVNAPEIKNLTQPIMGEIIYDFRKPITDKTDKKNKTPRGIGVTSEIDAEVKASSDGVVEFVGDSNLFGKTVVINHGDSFKTVYSNLKEEVTVSEGDEVKSGDVIGNVGDTSVYFVNAQYNPHLHFEIIASSKSYEEIMANYNENYEVFVNPSEYVEFTN